MPMGIRIIFIIIRVPTDFVFSGAATAFAEDMATGNATSAGVAEAGNTCWLLRFVRITHTKTAAGAEAIRPGTIYIQNNQGYYLSRIGPTGVAFSKTAPDQFCRFKADRVGGSYLTLRADNDLAITLDHGFDPPVLWLNRLYPVGWFEVVSTGDGKDYLVVYNPSTPDNGPWTVAGTNYNSGSINTVLFRTAFNGLYVIQA